MKYQNENYIKEMFNKIANSYDFMNNIISLGTHLYVKEEAIKNLKIKQNSKVLDLCCGSGDFGKIIQKRNENIEIIGVDFSVNMLNIAKKRNKNIQFIEANATNLPFENNYFDYIVIGFGLRNIINKEKSIREIYRVLKKDGYFLHLDFCKGSKINIIYNKIVKILAKIFTKNLTAYEYLINSKNNFLNEQELISIFEKENFEFYKSKKLLLSIISYQIMMKK